MAKRKNAPRIRLPEVLDMAAASALKAELLPLRGQPLEVDASAVQRAGGLCLQVLLSARITWDADGHALKFIEPSEALTDALACMGAGSLVQEATV